MNWRSIAFFLVVLFASHSASAGILSRLCRGLNQAVDTRESIEAGLDDAKVASRLGEKYRIDLNSAQDLAFIRERYRMEVNWFTERRQDEVNARDRRVKVGEETYYLQTELGSSDNIAHTYLARSSDGGWWVVKQYDSILRDLFTRELLFTAIFRRAGLPVVPIVQVDKTKLTLVKPYLLGDDFNPYTLGVQVKRPNGTSEYLAPSSIVRDSLVEAQRYLNEQMHTVMSAALMDPSVVEAVQRGEVRQDTVDYVVVDNNRGNLRLVVNRDSLELAVVDF